MTHEIVYQGSNALLKLNLSQGEVVKAESGAMVAMDATLTVEGKAQGGFMKGLGRMLTGESFFTQTITAKTGSGEVFLAPGLPGSIEHIELSSGKTWILQKGAFLAAETTVETKVKSQGLGKALFSGEGMFIIEAYGTGKLFINTYGQTHKVELDGTKDYIIDNGHLVAWEGSLNYAVEKASSGWVSSFTSGEGFVTRFKGKGTIYIQTRQIGPLASMLAGMIKK